MKMLKRYVLQYAHECLLRVLKDFGFALACRIEDVKSVVVNQTKEGLA